MVETRYEAGHKALHYDEVPSDNDAPQPAVNTPAKALIKPRKVTC